MDKKNLKLTCPDCGKERMVTRTMKYHVIRKGSSKCMSCGNKGNKGRTGQPLSDEHRAALLNAITGENNYLYGKHLPQETKDKISKSKIGSKASPETRKKMSDTHTGVKKSKEHAKHIGDAKRGVPLSDEHCEALRDAQLKIVRDSDYYRKIGALGKKKLSMLNGETSIEKKLYKQLELMGVRFDKQRIIGKRYLVDAYVPSSNYVIEADGDYWHSLPKQKKSDKRKDYFLTKHGINILRLTETEINNGSYKEKLEEVYYGSR